MLDFIQSSLVSHTFGAAGAQGMLYASYISCGSIHTQEPVTKPLMVNCICGRPKNPDLPNLGCVFIICFSGRYSSRGSHSDVSILEWEVTIKWFTQACEPYQWHPNESERPLPALDTWFCVMWCQYNMIRGCVWCLALWFPPTMALVSVVKANYSWIIRKPHMKWNNKKTFVSK